MSLNLDDRTQELCESRGGRPELPVPNKPYGLCGRQAICILTCILKYRAQELCESPPVKQAIIMSGFDGHPCTIISTRQTIIIMSVFSDTHEPPCPPVKKAIIMSAFLSDTHAPSCSHVKQAIITSVFLSGNLHVHTSVKLCLYSWHSWSVRPHRPIYISGSLNRD